MEWDGDHRRATRDGRRAGPRRAGHRGQGPKLLDQHCRAFALGYAEGWALDLPAALLLAAGGDRASA